MKQTVRQRDRKGQGVGVKWEEKRKKDN